MALKKYKPTSPGRRGLVLVDRSVLWKGRPVKDLTEGLKKSGGRNNHGHITARHRAAGISAGTGSWISSVAVGMVFQQS